MHKRAYICLLVLSTFGCGSSDTPDAPGAAERLGSAEVALSKTDGQLVFESIRSESMDGKVISLTTIGDLPYAIFQQVGRPSSYLHEPWIYQEETWSRKVQEGLVERGYRVTREPNLNPVVLQSVTWGPPEIDPLLVTELRAPKGSYIAQALVKLRNFPDWDIPLLPTDYAQSIIDLDAALKERETAIEQRKKRLDTMAMPVIAAVESAGGRIVKRHWSSGWLHIEAPPETIAALLSRSDLARVTTASGEGGPLGWILGAGRSPGRLDVDRYWAAGSVGNKPNPTRHNYGRLVAGVIEPGVFEDEACAFYDGATCTGASRILERRLCTDADNDGDYCETVANFDDTDDDDHGTLVSATILGDYTDDQGCGQALGDPYWSGGCHSSLWENEASGMAPEAGLVYFGGIKPGAEGASFADAFADARDLHVDVLNNSWGWNTGPSICNPVTWQLYEEEAENAFDDGILVVVAAGNSNGPSASSCNVNSPADLVKSVAVNAFDASSAQCQSDYNACLVDPIYSARGGGSATVGSTTYAAALSMVDLVAPNRYTRATVADGDYGTVLQSGGFYGTSAAAPHVTGLALLIKDHHLAIGQTWVNTPGRLQTYLLAMSDRHHSVDPSNPAIATSQRMVGADDLYGLGRIKMRLFDGSTVGPWWVNLRMMAFTTGSKDVTYFPFSDPLPSGVAVVKCVMLQAEDMSTKTNISDIDLTLAVKDSVGGVCNTSGMTVFSRDDQSQDTKKMVAIDGNETSLTGRCVEVTLKKSFVTSAGIQTHEMCYYAAVQDDAPMP